MNAQEFLEHWEQGEAAARREHSSGSLHPESSTVRVELKMRVLEYHTFEREVNKADFDHHRKHGDVTSWLEEQFKDDPMPDSDISTESFELDEWKLLKSPNDQTLPTPAPK